MKHQPTLTHKVHGAHGRKVRVRFYVLRPSHGGSVDRDYLTELGTLTRLGRSGFVINGVVGLAANVEEIEDVAS